MCLLTASLGGGLVRPWIYLQGEALQKWLRNRLRRHKQKPGIRDSDLRKSVSVSSLESEGEFALEELDVDRKVISWVRTLQPWFSWWSKGWLSGEGWGWGLGEAKNVGNYHCSSCALVSWQSAEPRLLTRYMDGNAIQARDHIWLIWKVTRWQ